MPERGTSKQQIFTGLRRNSSALSENGEGWKGSLNIVYFNLPLHPQFQNCSPTASCPVLCPEGLWVSPRMETPVHHVFWVLNQPLSKKVFFLLFKWILLYFRLCSSPLEMSLCSTKRNLVVFFTPPPPIFPHGWDAHLNLCYSRLKSPSTLCLSSYGRCFSALITFTVIKHIFDKRSISKDVLHYSSFQMGDYTPSRLLIEASNTWFLFTFSSSEVDLPLMLLNMQSPQPYLMHSKSVSQF